MNFNFGEFNPYSDAAGSLQGPANTLMRIMMELPEKRAQAAEMMARTGLIKEQTNTEGLQQGLYRAKTANQLQQTGFNRGLADSAPGLLSTLSPTAPPAATPFASNLAGVGNNPEQTMKALGSLALMLQAGNPGNVSAGVFGPTPNNRSIGNMHTPTTLGPDQRLFSATTGTNAPVELAHNPRSFNPAGNQNVNTQLAMGVRELEAWHSKEFSAIANNIVMGDQERTAAMQQLEQEYVRRKAQIQSLGALTGGLPAPGVAPTPRTNNIKSITPIP